MKELNKDVINQFTINVALIDPIKDILRKLERGEFRDCDIKWLDDRLEKYTSTACKTLNIPFARPSSVLSEGYTLMNEYVKTRYTKYFTTLLNYFKDVNQ
jgi:hypothetical protein